MLQNMALRANNLRVFAAGAALFLLNAAICWRLFFVEYLPHFGSIEPVFYAIEKAIRLRWPALGWWAQSNLGYPFDYAYQPLLHYTVALAAAITGWHEARAYHVVLALLYVAGPVTLFALILRFTRSPGASFTAGLLYSVVSPSALLFSKIRLDLDGAWFGRRLQTAVVWGDGPHVCGLTLVPLALLFLDRALERKTTSSRLLAAIFLIAVPLTNIPAGISLGMALTAYVLAQDWPKLPGALFAAIAALLSGFLLFAPWLAPSGLLTTVRNTAWMSPAGRFSVEKLPYYLFLIAITGLAAVLTRRLRVPFPARFGILLTAISGTVVGLVMWRNLALIGQADRFHLVLEMGIVVALVAIGHSLVPWSRTVCAVFAVALCIFTGYQYAHLRKYARHIVNEADVRDRSEFRIAAWMKEHAVKDRVYVTGSGAFWLNYLDADADQVLGCCDQNTLVPVMPAVHYILSSDDGAGEHPADISIEWLQVLGVRYVVVDGPASNEVYHDFRHPAKFDGVLKEVWRDHGDVIYEVPLGSASLAHPVRPEDLATRLPANGIDMQPMFKYRAALLDSKRPPATFQWTSASDAVIRGDLPKGSVYSVQISYHPGWQATSPDGAEVAVGRDPMGLMTLSPACDGPCEVRLHFDGGLEARLLRALAVIAWLTAGFLFVRERRRAAA